MIEFGALPPEVNSGRIYAGVGPGPMLDAVAAWESIVAQLGAVGASIEATISMLAAANWQGPSAMAMVAKAQPFIEWVERHAAQAQVAASTASSHAAAYSTAFAAVVPPVAIEANRDALMTAIGGLPFTAPAVAALEAEYNEMWAQSASAMYAYSAASTAAAAPMLGNPFLPPMTGAADPTAAGAAAAQAAGQSAGDAGTNTSSAMQALSGMGGSLGDVASAPSQAMGSLGQLASLPSSMMGSLGGSMGAANPTDNSSLTGGGMFLGGFGGAGGSLGGVGGGSVGGISGSPVNAMMGNAGRMGRLSVPAGWAESSSRSLSSVEGTALRAAPAAEEQAVVGTGGRGGIALPPGAGGSKDGASAPPVSNKLKSLKEAQLVGQMTFG